MLKKEDFKTESQQVIQWIDDYFGNLKSLPVKSQVKPKEIYNQIPTTIPTEGTNLSNILKDTTDIILPGITHWQHPNFHAYFNANSSVESVYAEVMTAAIGAQCMIWDTSPAAAELEERMTEWLRDAMGLPNHWEGVIQDTASTATLVAIISAREKASNFTSNEQGVMPNLRVYCSDQTHSSIEKAVMICGIGRKNLVKIKSDHHQRLDAEQLEIKIKEDLNEHRIPCCVIATLGSTSTAAVDDLEAISKICQRYEVWLHIDAAYAGTALLLPEYQWMMKGGQAADSFVFNPHKWMFTNFDCTLYFVKEAAHLIKTFEILPEYLKTKTRGQVNDYRDWGIPLGRRFRALKLWFVMRSYGLSGIQERLRHHISLNNYFCKKIKAHPLFQLVQEPILNFCCIAYTPTNSNQSSEQVNDYNRLLLESINESGKAFLSHTLIEDRYVIRVVMGQTYIEMEDVDNLLNIINEVAGQLENITD